MIPMSPVRSHSPSNFSSLSYGATPEDNEEKFAGAQPFAVELLLVVLRGRAVVLRGDPRPADLDLADGLAVPGLDALVGRDPHVHPRQDATLTGPQAPVLVAAGLDLGGRQRDRAHRARLGHPPALDDLHVVALLE